MCTEKYSAISSGARNRWSWSHPWLLLALALALLAPGADAGKDYYKILGVPKKVNEKQLKRAYKKQAMKWHPDKHQTSKEKATVKFQEIAEAYETLSDPKKRKLYDLGGEEAVKGQPPPEEPPKQTGRAGSKARGHGGPGGFRHQGFSAYRESGQGAGPNMDQRAYQEAFAKMYGGQARSGIDPRAYQEAYAKMFGGQGGAGFGAGGSTFGQKPAGDSKPKSGNQGGPLFASSPVQELNFADHEAQIKALSQHWPAAVLFYASGGKSCPSACHRIQKEYVKLAESHGFKAAVAAVQCTHRKGKCAEYADRFPAVVLFEKGARREAVLTAGTSTSASLLQRKLDKALARREGLEELTEQHFREAGAGDVCEGQFCLLLLERGPEGKTEGARKALRAAAERLGQEPVQAFYLRADKYPDFAKPFEAQLSLSTMLKSFMRVPAARVVLYRPKRKTFEVFEGKVEDAKALAEFAQNAINRGTSLSQRLEVTPLMKA